MNEAIKELEKINEQQREYIKVIKGDIESLKESYKIAHEYNEVADKEIERLNNIINKINKMLEADTYCEDIYYAIGVLLNKRFFDIKMVDNEELLNILGSDRVSEEELKQIWDNLFNKLNETEKTYLAIISNEKNKQIEELKKQLQQKENIIKEVREYIEHKASIRECYMINGKEYKELLKILDKE